MDFKFSEEQEALRQRLRAPGQEKLIPKRALYEDKEEYPPDLIEFLRKE